MPNYQQPFGALGGAAGGAAGAAGGGFLGRLGSLLEPLDYPRQALYNLVAKGGKALSGEGSWGDLLGAVPGALGAGLAGGLMATGVGAPLGILAGSALGGLAQGFGKSSGDERFQAPTTDDLVKHLGGDPTSDEGKVGSFALGALTDPLTYAGGLGGAARGEQLGKNAGQYLEHAALTRGPRYTGLDPHALTNAAFQAGDPEAHTRLLNLFKQPEWPQLASEIPAGSMPLGAGGEAIALRRPDGGVVRIGGGPGTLDLRAVDPRDRLRGNAPAPSPRADIPELLQANRSVAIGPYRVEHMPHVTVPEGQVGGNVMQLGPQGMDHMGMIATDLEDAIRGRGYIPQDMHPGNFGFTPEGRAVVVDPGSIDFHDEMVRPAEQFQRTEGGPVTNAILRLLGSDRSVQREIAQGVSQVPAGVGIPVRPYYQPGQARQAVPSTRRSLLAPAWDGHDIQ